MVAEARLVVLFAETTRARQKRLSHNTEGTVGTGRLGSNQSHAPAVDRVPRNVERRFQLSRADGAYRVFRADCKAKRAISRSNTSFRRRPHVLDATRILWLFSRIRAELVGEFSLVIRRR